MRGVFYKKFARAVKLRAGGRCVASGEVVGEWVSDPSRRRTSQVNQIFRQHTHNKK